jgi:hypothetical protein
MSSVNGKVFKDFSEYWYYARTFSDKQKEIIFASLSGDEQRAILNSSEKGRWGDVLNRNILDHMVDDIKKEYGFDLIDIRYKVINNKSVYLPTSFWSFVLERFGEYDDKHVDFILGDIVAIICKENKRVTLLVPSYSNVRN